MVNQELINYLKQRIGNGENYSEILNDLRLDPEFDEVEANNSMSYLVKENINGQIKGERNQYELYSFILLGIGVILVLFGYSSLNATRKGFPSFLGFLLIIISILFYIGPTKLSLLMKKWDEKKKEIETMKNKRE